LLLVEVLLYKSLALLPLIHVIIQLLLQADFDSFMEQLNLTLSLILLLHAGLLSNELVPGKHLLDRQLLILLGLLQGKMLQFLFSLLK